MNDEQFRFLSLMGQLPPRLTAQQTAWYLNCQPHDLPALVAAKLLKPLGNPSANSIKFYATADLMELAKDRNWLVRASNTIYQHWSRKNLPERKRPGNAAVTLGLTPPGSPAQN